MPHESPSTTETGAEDRPLDLAVAAIPPVKQTPADPAERARQVAANGAIAAAFNTAFPVWRMYSASTALEMSIEYERGVGRSDSANIIGGIADQLERRGAYHNDRQLRSIRYDERPSADQVDRYVIRVRPITAS